MSEITLSSAVRSNLLNLQQTATLLGKTQERLATGLKVNSALDNPTNFFTASSLNARSADLGRLLDSVSNAVQTIAAADKGLTALTKLVESAQATARQALQTSATVDGVTGATSAVIASSNSANTSSLTIADGSAQVTASDATTNLTSFIVDDGSASVPAEAAKVVGGSFTAVDFTNSGADDGAFSFDIELDNSGTPTTVTVGFADVDGVAASNSAVTAAELVGIINDKLNTALSTTGVSYASVGTGGGIDFTSTTSGASSQVDITGFAATAGATGSGIANVSDAGAALVPSVADTSGSITINGQSIALADGDNFSAVLSKLQAAATASGTGANQFTVSNSSGTLTISGSNGNDLVVSGLTTDQASALGLANGTINGDAAVTDTSGSFIVNGQTISLADGDDAAAILGKFQAAATASGTGANQFTVSNASGVLTLSGTAGNDIVVSGLTAGQSTALGLTNGTVNGTPANLGTPTQVANPKRDELRVQYNDLLDQIDQLAKDAGFNGVNLLNGDSLSVLFNEDGSSSLDVNGVTYTAAGLGLTALSSGDFNTNTSINDTLNTLKEGIDTLRTQSSKFGSNLSVVETRQDFTKNMINVLETGAANLTLADSNEEAANLLALQTRQQLSSTALSLASQADQNVLRLF